MQVVDRVRGVASYALELFDEVALAVAKRFGCRLTLDPGPGAPYSAAALHIDEYVSVRQGTG